MRLSELLANENVRIRITDEDPPRYSVVDVMRIAIGDIDSSQASRTYKRTCKHFDLEVGIYKFGRGTLSPVCTAEQVEMLLQTLPGKRAAAFRVTGDPQVKNTRVEHLYVMRYSNDNTKVKIGKSHNPEARRASLESGQAFRVEILAIFPRKGCLEARVDQLFDDRRCIGGAGMESIDIPPCDAVAAVCKALQEIELEKSKLAASS